MIGKLKGVVDSAGEDFAIIDVQGVGYLVHCSWRTLQNLPKPGEPVSLAIETQLREDDIRLFGFASEAEREWFRLLQSVQGVGPKAALAIQSVLDAARLAAAIVGQDRTAIARAAGVGPKLAARIIAELKEKALAAGVAEKAGVELAGGSAPAVKDALSALVNLGYARPQAEAAVAAAAAALGENPAAPELIRLGLKELAK